MDEEDDFGKRLNIPSKFPPENKWVFPVFSQLEDVDSSHNDLHTQQCQCHGLRGLDKGKVLNARPWCMWRSRDHFP